MISVDLLKKLRNQHGWTQEQLAQISGVSARTIQRIESSGECSLETKMALAAAFNLSPHYLSGNDTALTGLPAVSAPAHFVAWALLMGSLVLLLLVAGDGVIRERLHINADVMAVAWLVLSVRTMKCADVLFLLSYSLGFSKANSPMSVRQAILSLQQLIRFSYLSGLFAFCFHGWHMSQMRVDLSFFSVDFATLMIHSAIASICYAVFVAEFIFRPTKLKLESQLLKENTLFDTQQASASGQ